MTARRFESLTHPGENMEEVIYYLELKNQYYEKFQSVTEKFLEHAARDNWEDIEFFVDNRERILNIIRSFDFKIAEAFDRTDPSLHNLDLYRSRVKGLMDRRAELGNRIVALDLELISKLEEVKNETVRELKKTVETNQQIQSFSAHNPPAPPTSAPRKPTKDA